MTPDRPAPTTFVSVVIPCYNAAGFVARAVESVRGQEEVETQIIAIDDGSTDGTPDVLSKLGQAVFWETGANAGACAARNRGLALADAPFTMFLDADDYIEPGTLAALVAALSEDNADIAFAPVIERTNTGDRPPRRRPRTGCTSEFVIDWITGSYIPPCGVLWRTETVRSIGGWDENLRKNQDGELVLRAAIAGAKLAVSNEGAAVYWHHDGAHRISNVVSEVKLQDSFEVLCRCRDHVAVTEEASNEIERAFSVATHDLERMAARHALDALQERIHVYRQGAGWPTFEGGTYHRIGSRLLGLKAKEKLAQFLVSIRGRKAKQS
ncbi:Glycosyltransferase, GT2 family [Tropicimonas isoalkanivorans]|uniref:Glycosyltransferase, GT2 family n=2 Tax=Tropicimonas isoalkanivorans TaxID=441112 RepID=A0A1I1DS71_9RHOB|nr:Glycosyltransferase, GT2 family [Tropicimonas isoalkanivorans]